MKAVVYLDVPEYQIGSPVKVYFKDTLVKKGMCERMNTHTFQRCIRCGKKLKDDVAKERGYGKVCWQKHLVDKQNTLF